MSFLSDLADILVNRAGVGKKKTLYCQKCKKDTEHIQESYANSGGRYKDEWNKMDGHEKFENIGLKILDHVPLIPTVVAGNTVKCTVCNKQSSNGGILSGEDPWNG
ncbi:MAG: hypothetical protein AAFZ15_24955 [Bacteroidota bacterium]